MRHRVAGRKLSRTGEHRLAMRRNLAAALFEHETISTTVEKAKDVRSFAERLITLAKKGTLSARRQAVALLGNRDIIKYEEGKPIKKGKIIGKLFSELGPRYLDRPGGYTRIIQLSLKRLGDNGQLVLLQLIGPDETLEKKTKAATKRATRGKTKKAKIEKTSQVEESAEEITEEDIESKQTTKAEETASTKGRADESAPEV